MAGQAAEQRPIIAHDVSRGFRWQNAFSPGEGERMVRPWIFCRPIRGLNLLRTINPQLHCGLFSAAHPALRKMAGGKGWHSARNCGPPQGAGLGNGATGAWLAGSEKYRQAISCSFGTPSRSLLKVSKDWGWSSHYFGSPGQYHETASQYFAKHSKYRGTFNQSFVAPGQSFVAPNPCFVALNDYCVGSTKCSFALKKCFVASTECFFKTKEYFVALKKL